MPLIKKVLVIDDAQNIQEAVGFILRKRGYAVETALNGAEGLSKVHSFKPDLVICDVMMPVMDGIAFLQNLRKDPTTEKIAVLMLTAKRADEDILKGYGSGADYYLPKPFKTEELIYGIDFLETAMDQEKMGTD